SHGAGKAGRLELTPPRLEITPKTACRVRPGSLGWDLAEFLARVARARLRLTQAGRINRRDLRAMESAFGVQTYGYPVFLYILAVALGTLGGTEDGVLLVRDEADTLLGQPEVERARLTLTSWVNMGGYPESAPADPADYEYLPMLLSVQRAAMAEALASLPPGEVVTVASLARRLAWQVPLSFRQWDADKNPVYVAERLVRSLFWLGLAAVDSAETPKHVQPSPLALHQPRNVPPDAPRLVPEEAQFFLQPNAEAFAPPNLAPRTLYHLRRVTGEKKGGAAGVFPVTQESVRRALDSGLTIEGILRFLEAFSRTGLPGPVRSLVESVGRHHGRIRLVPAGYVLVTEDETLLHELNSAKPIAPYLGPQLTERARAVDPDRVPDLLRRLRARGYAPVDEGEVVEVGPLPSEPAEMPPPIETATDSVPAGPVHPLLLDWSAVEGEPAAPTPAAELAAGSGERVTARAQIRQLLERAAEEELEVEIEYHGSSSGDVTVRTIQPYYVNSSMVEAFCCLRGDDRHFKLPRIAWARLTGNAFGEG
ncbi:MAG TPA: helicase-associated domain-containing protein, partial [Armatimonadota bacterium]|nr:helicase-associated domain-containing protein [Armatimonadota bacterium]